MHRTFVFSQYENILVEDEGFFVLRSCLSREKRSHTEIESKEGLKK